MRPSMETSGNSVGTTEFNAPTLAEELLQQFHIKTFVDTGEMLIYVNGCYRRFGEQFLRRETQRRLGEQTTTHKVNEVIEYIRRETVINRNHFNNENKVSVLNGILNLESLTIEPHTPELLTTIQLPVYYDPSADCPNVRRFISQIVDDENTELLWEVLANCLNFHQGIQRAVLLIGDGCNGKSTFLNLVRAFLGSENCVSASLQSLETNRFTVATLYGKLACLFADLPSHALRSISTFKLLTGSDSLVGEEKFRSPFFFVNKAKLIFSCNQPPRVFNEDSYALWRRFVLVPFPNRFVGAAADRNILGKLTTASELSGLLNQCISVLRRLKERGEFSYKLSVDETADWYLRLSDPVFAFIQDRCQLKSEAWTSTDDLYAAFLTYSKERRIPLITRERFCRELRNHPNIRPQRATIGERERGWQGIQLRPESACDEDNLDEP